MRMDADRSSGVREEMLERGIMAFVSGTPSSAAAQIAGLDRSAFINVLIERGIPIAGETPDETSCATCLVAAVRGAPDRSWRVGAGDLEWDVEQMLPAPGLSRGMGQG